AHRAAPRPLCPPPPAPRHGPRHPRRRHRGPRPPDGRRPHPGPAAPTRARPPPPPPRRLDQALSSPEDAPAASPLSPGAGSRPAGRTTIVEDLGDPREGEPPGEPVERGLGRISPPSTPARPIEAMTTAMDGASRDARLDSDLVPDPRRVRRHGD